MIPKNVANKVLSNLDNAALRIESLVKTGKMSQRMASSMIRELDSFADRFEVAAYGRDSLKRRMAAVLQMDADESHYMSSFENPNKVVSANPDSDYLHSTGPSARWADPVNNFDADRSSTVQNRPEYHVRDLSEFSESKKQPSWSGPARKSTASTSKKWAD